MNRRCSIRPQKRTHRRQMFIYELPGTPSRTIRAKAKLTSKIWDYSGDVPTARQRTHHRMTTAHLVG
jgi:hypothetical protein